MEGSIHVLLPHSRLDINCVQSLLKKKEKGEKKGKVGNNLTIGTWTVQEKSLKKKKRERKGEQFVNPRHAFFSRPPPRSQRPASRACGGGGGGGEKGKEREKGLGLINVSHLHQSVFRRGGGERKNRKVAFLASYFFRNEEDRLKKKEGKEEGIRRRLVSIG